MTFSPVYWVDKEIGKLICRFSFFYFGSGGKVVGGEASFCFVYYFGISSPLKILLLNCCMF